MPVGRSVLLATGAAVSGSVMMLWQMFNSQPAILPLAERKQRLARAEEKFQQQFPKVRNITVQQAQQLLQQQPERYVVVDVRNQDEQQVSMLPGNNVITLDHYKQQQELYKDKTAICYCTVGYRSSLAAEELLNSGVQSVNLKGGVLAWTHAGLPLVSGVNHEQQTKQVHTYGATWAYHGDGYEPVYYNNMYLRLLQDELDKLTKRFLGSAKNKPAE